MKALRPTVRRDISLFSIEAWERGYRKCLRDHFGWEYPIIFHYDGIRVHFYHTEQDFLHFKSVITKRLIDDDVLFEKLNNQFKKNTAELEKKVSGTFSATEKVPDTFFENLRHISNLIGEIMSFYIFMVSDAFVSARPIAWESRKMSEGILYECDEQVERHMKHGIKRIGIDEKISHVLCVSEYEKLARREWVDIAAIQNRMSGYIFTDSSFCSDRTFEVFCANRGYEFPIHSMQSANQNEVRGAVAYEGRVRGLVTIIHNKQDLCKIKEGDIFVSCMTNATYVVGMQKCAAIVTDEGGITCHAAIMARELCKPCITGTKNATRCLKDGDLVEVDAYKGIVRIV